MLKALRNRTIAAAFAAWTTAVRARRVLTSLLRPRLRLLDHVTIPVDDLAVARRFYCDVLGGAFLLEIDAAALARFGRPPAPDGGDGTFHVSVYLGGATRIDLFLQRDGQPAPLRGHPHYAFRVTPRDLLRFQDRLRAHGVPTEGPLQLGFPGQASLYFNDPAGNLLELTCTGFPRAIPVRPPDLTGLAWTPA
ncbi:VOC family protein [Nannocystis bainbridge]|uniref:VOC family protein n=1 Tax=Nannocystis bainbridge TaxID=2995303 RepID=A0ABT5E4F3_9BACT|nr:VOC family protein [Nannocystis bainbridge]MDC0720746.1 VOC family protein [Nannocystis bainbridge]